MDNRKEKHEVLSEYFAGGTSTRKLGLKYGYGRSTVVRWIMAHKKYGKHQPEPVPPDKLSLEDMPTDIKELQEALRISRLKKVDLLKIRGNQRSKHLKKRAYPISPETFHMLFS